MRSLYLPLFSAERQFILWRFAFREAIRDRTRAQRTAEFVFTFAHGFVLARSLFTAACNLHSQLNPDKRIYYRRAFSICGAQLCWRDNTSGSQMHSESIASIAATRRRQMHINRSMHQLETNIYSLRPRGSRLARRNELVFLEMSKLLRLAVRLAASRQSRTCLALAMQSSTSSENRRAKLF